MRNKPWKQTAACYNNSPNWYKPKEYTQQLTFTNQSAIISKKKSDVKGAPGCSSPVAFFEMFIEYFHSKLPKKNQVFKKK